MPQGSVLMRFTGVVLGIALAAVGSVQAEEAASSDTAASQPRSALQQRWDKIFTASDNPFALEPYQQNYLLYTYSTSKNVEAYQSSFEKDNADANDLDKHEAKFQLSLLIPVWRPLIWERTGLFASYTQVSMWQAANSKISSPFRETDYEPQLFVANRFDWDLYGLNLRAAEMGFNHQSNGRSGELSRSWNRLYTTIYADHGNFSTELRLWHRIAEDEADDDNPDINRYMGYYHLGLNYKLDQAVISSKVRYNWNTGYGSGELGLSYPLLKNLRVYGQVFSGYGETLIDYNHNQTRFGLGIMLGDLL
jgi:phospholipase A1/A2